MLTLDEKLDLLGTVRVALFLQFEPEHAQTMFLKLSDLAEQSHALMLEKIFLGGGNQILNEIAKS